MPKLLVGNKCDLVQDSREVDNQAQHCAEKNKMQYFKTSAFTNTNVNEMCNNII